jgi:flagellar biosynthesis/type III secretory pathway chaperone
MQTSTGATVTTDTGWEQELGDLLAELTTVQSELLAVLNAKREAVARGDIEAVDALRPRAEHLLDQLQTFQNRRAHLLQFAAEQGLPSSSLSKLVTHAAPSQRNKLGKQVKESAARMRLVQHQCLANWVLAQRSLLHISQMLEIIATGGRLLPTYGPGEPTLTGGALVDQEA